MRLVRRRTKKLIVAFHFHREGQAGWKCDECRKHGLELRRRCGWLPEALATPPRVVWLRGAVAIDTCPTSYVSADSISWIEEFFAWKLSSGMDVRQLRAKSVDAFAILNKELQTERNNA